MDGQFAYVAALAKLTEPEEGFTASISVEVRLSQGTVTVDIDTSGTIDLGAEKKRLEKDLAAAQKELVTADNKLANRSEEHTSELQSLMRISYAVFCLKKKICKKHAR